MTTIAPGARILCRDAEWRVKSTDIASDGGRVIEAIGVSEFIQGKRAIALLIYSCPPRGGPMSRQAVPRFTPIPHPTYLSNQVIEDARLE